MKADNAAKLKKFVKDRGWEKYHTPSELARAIMIEGAELNRLFLWGDSWQILHGPGVADELADLTIYIHYLATELAIDLDAVVARKIVKNGEKYPATNS